jgi:hypothetical protein
MKLSFRGGGSVRVPVGAGGARASGGGVRALILSNFDTKWFQIAVAHERAARSAREDAIAAPDGSREMGEAFDQEMQAAMVVVAAAAFAIDALYVKVNEMLDPAARSYAKGRIARIVETFKTAFELNKRTAKWQNDISVLFDLRGELVHFRGEAHESEPHPTGKSNVSRENSVYTVERATWAVDQALEVLTVAYSSPRATHSAIVAWAESAAHVPAWLEELRNAGPDDRGRDELLVPAGARTLRHVSSSGVGRTASS